MLKKILGCTCLMLTAFWLMGPSSARALTFTDIIDATNPTIEILSGYSGSFEGLMDVADDFGPSKIKFVHDLTDSGQLPVPFDPLLHPLASATLEITVEKPDPHLAKRRLEVSWDGSGPQEYQFKGEGGTAGFTVDVALLQTDGQLEVIVEATKRAFLFKDSTLTADVAAMPEPSTLILLGTGLAGVAGWGLRRRKQEEQS